MITHIRTELTDAERNRLSLLFYPDKRNRLASRAEVTDYVQGYLAYAVKASRPPTKENAPTGKTLLLELAVRERETCKAVKGKSDSFIIGWCKVKYADRLRGAQ